MVWSHIPDFDTTTTAADDNPFTRPKQSASQEGINEHADR